MSEVYGYQVVALEKQVSLLEERLDALVDILSSIDKRVTHLEDEVFERDYE